MMTTYPTSDGLLANAFVVPERSTSTNVLIVIHEAWGLTEAINERAKQYAEEFGPNVRVIAVDLYDGKLVANFEELAEARKTWAPGRFEAILTGAIALAGEDANIAVIGWCMGGAWSLKTALMAADKCAACVAYYGTMVTDVVQLAQLSAPVLAIFGKQDQHITQAHADEFEAAMAQAGKSLTRLDYDANHAFANPDRPNYDANAAMLADREASKFLREKWLSQ